MCMVDRLSGGGGGRALQGAETSRTEPFFGGSGIVKNDTFCQNVSS